MKIDKEEMVGLVVALQRFLSRNHAVDLALWESIVDGWVTSLGGLSGMSVCRKSSRGEAGLPIPRVRITFRAATALSAASIHDRLREGLPSIDVAMGDASSILLGPEGLCDGEADQVTTRLLEIIEATA